MSSTEADYDDEVAEPFRFNFEIAWEVANKGLYTTYTSAHVHHVYTSRILVCVYIPRVQCSLFTIGNEPLIRTPLGECPD